MLLLIQAAQDHATPGADSGFNPFDPAGVGGMLWTWLIFLIGLPLMWKIVMGPITKALEARDERASQAIRDAETAREETAKARAQALAVRLKPSSAADLPPTERAAARNAWSARTCSGPCPEFDRQFPPGYFGHRAAFSPGGRFLVNNSPGRDQNWWVGD